MGLFVKVKKREGLIDENDSVEIIKNTYSDIPKGSISRVNHIQFNYWGQGAHAYYVIWDNSNRIFRRNEIKLNL